MGDEAVRRPATLDRYELSVSEPLFRLMTECVHHISNDTKTLARLDTVVALRAAQAAQGIPGQTVDALRGHLETLATQGDVRVSFSVDAATAGQLAAACACLAERLGRTVELADALSLLLFDVTVERASALLLERMLGEEAIVRRSGDDAHPRDAAGEVFPFR